MSDLEQESWSFTNLLVILIIIFFITFVFFSNCHVHHAYIIFHNSIFFSYISFLLYKIWYNFDVEIQFQQINN